MSLWANIQSNPSAFAALIAAFFTLVSFLFNYRATLRNQRDQQFYEALKRFGDGASPALRSSASGLLAQMAKTRTSFRRPYLTTALDQLMMGVFLETNPLTLRAIGRAIAEIVEALPRLTIPALRDANFRLQEDIVTIVAQLGALEDSPSGAQPTVEARSVGRYAPSLIGTLLDAHAERVTEARWEIARQCAELGAPAKRERRAALEESLRVAGARLEQNCVFLQTALTGLFSGVVSYERWHTPQGPRIKARASPLWRQRARAIFLDGIFLPGFQAPMRAIAKIDFDSAILTGADFGSCLMQDCRFVRAHLEGACFAGAILKSRVRVSKHGWSLKGSVDLASTHLNDADFSEAQMINVRMENAVVTGARMIHTRITHTWLESWKGTNWWRAQFLPPGVSAPDPSADSSPPSAFATLYAEYKADIPTDASELDPSIAKFLGPHS